MCVLFLFLLLQTTVAICQIGCCQQIGCSDIQELLLSGKCFAVVIHKFFARQLLLSCRIFPNIDIYFLKMAAPPSCFLAKANVTFYPF